MTSAPQTSLKSAKSIEEIYSHLPDAPSQKTLERVDYEARHWSSDIPGPLKPGTDEHKRATAQMFRDTFNPYKPSVIPWPELDPVTLHRITSLPIWDIAVQTEGKARLRMAAYAAMIDDPEMKDALSRNAWEENRHKEVLSKLVEAYKIKMAPEPEYKEPKDTEWAYLVTGFSECVDSFFAFGLFALAERSGLFPLELIETFEPVMQEECRHILLFANWLAWHRAVMPFWKRPWFELRVIGVWLFLAYERMGLARSMDDNGEEHTQDNNFTVNGAKDVTNIDIKVPELMQLCLDEDARRFSGYDVRLKRPTTTPAIARVIIKGAKLWDKAQTRFGKRKAAA
ncbi:ferritin-like domain-containing protein [Neokomagataea anthophila]|uniref:Ferritin-like domain-containing protein n=1 Tax=Neokomagataea anthophila TaxID=2826925 RepID=A0ABS5E4X6_9PROT|nr:ferritin-like domain-containing protein [Neokomagataea anthophila]MBR0558940.1 ferritin-like domain-containing protein [Neokomagataea anthophila]